MGRQVIPCGVRACGRIRKPPWSKGWPIMKRLHGSVAPRAKTFLPSVSKTGWALEAFKIPQSRHGPVGKLGSHHCTARHNAMHHLLKKLPHNKPPHKKGEPSGLWPSPFAVPPYLFIWPPNDASGSFDEEIPLVPIGPGPVCDRTPGNSVAEPVQLFVIPAVTRNGLAHCIPGLRTRH